MYKIRNRKKVLTVVLSGGSSIKDFCFLNLHQKFFSMKDNILLPIGSEEIFYGSESIITGK